MKKIKLVFVFLSFVFITHAQEDLLSILESESPEDKQYAIATFKSTRIINGQSIETRTQGTLEFIISHRFGTLNSGVNELWGLDRSNIRLGLEYGITDNLTFGVGRSSYDKTLDLFGKYRLVRQSNYFPITATFFASLARNLDNRADESGLERNAYTGQLLLARKFNDRLSFQLAPTMIQRNRVESLDDANFLLALGIGARYKITNRIAIVSEYTPVFTDLSDRFFNAVAMGVDIETGGHVFQLHFTNAEQSIEKGFIGEVDQNFWDGGIHYGFNIVRVFDLKSKRRSFTD